MIICTYNLSKMHIGLRLRTYRKSLKEGTKGFSARKLQGKMSNWLLKSEFKCYSS